MATKLRQPELMKYVDKRLIVKLDCGRQVSGVLRGYDQFMNMTLEDFMPIEKDGKASTNFGTAVIRGSSITMLESLDPVAVTNYAPKTR
jgi:small nuclear ribonucleoprotein G